MENKRATFSTSRAVEAQLEYCKRAGVPMIAPGLDGKCYKCGRGIYRFHTVDGRHSPGISVEEASASLVTKCPHCGFEFI